MKLFQVQTETYVVSTGGFSGVFEPDYIDFVGDRVRVRRGGPGETGPVLIDLGRLPEVREPRSASPAFSTNTVYEPEGFRQPIRQLTAEETVTLRQAFYSDGFYVEVTGSIHGRNGGARGRGFGHLIAFGTCRSPGAIVRIKLKYADGSLTFYEELLTRFKQKFGEPDEYQGDPFRVFISWKWSLKDQNQNRVSMVLQHNLKDGDEKIGNAVKLTLHNRLEEDVRCYKQQKPHRRYIVRQRPPPAPSSSASAWGRFRPY